MNYGPLVEFIDDDNESRVNYEKIDQLFFDIIQKWNGTNLEPSQIKDFAIGDRIDGGMELMIPGEYFNIMKAY